MGQQGMNVAETETPSIKARILKKMLQYGEGILINWLSAITLLGFLWVVQLIWGLRLIPFSLLDALLLAGGSMLIILIVIVACLYFTLRHYLTKHPGMAIGLVIGLFATAMAVAHADKITEFFQKATPLAPMKEAVGQKKTTPPTS